MAKSLGLLIQVNHAQVMIFNVANVFYSISENKILAKISKFTVLD